MGGKTVVKKKPEKVVTVVFGSLKPYFHFALTDRAGLNPLPQKVKLFHIVWNSEDVGRI